MKNAKVCPRGTAKVGRNCLEIKKLAKELVNAIHDNIEYIEDPVRPSDEHEPAVRMRMVAEELELLEEALKIKREWF